MGSPDLEFARAQEVNRALTDRSIALGATVARVVGVLKQVQEAATYATEVPSTADEMLRAVERMAWEELAREMGALAPRRRPAAKDTGPAAPAVDGDLADVLPYGLYPSERGNIRFAMLASELLRVREAAVAVVERHGGAAAADEMRRAVAGRRTC